MNRLHFGDIVLLKFPFTDNKTFKRRPALIINDFNGDIIVCRITTQIYKTSYDVMIDEWKKSGLKLPSVILVHKLPTLEKEMVEMKLGKINNSIGEKVKGIISKLTDHPNLANPT